MSYPPATTASASPSLSRSAPTARAVAPEAQAVDTVIAGPVAPSQRARSCAGASYSASRSRRRLGSPASAFSPSSTPPRAVPTTTATRDGSSGRGRKPDSVTSSSAADRSKRVARLSGTRLEDLIRSSSLISPPSPTRRSATGNRSICEMPDVPARSADQNASTPWPMGVERPAAAIAIRSRRELVIPLEKGRVVHPERANRPLGRVEEMRGLEPARSPVEGDHARHVGVVDIVDQELHRTILADPVVVDHHGVIELPRGEVGHQPLDEAPALQLRQCLA